MPNLTPLRALIVLSLLRFSFAAAQTAPAPKQSEPPTSLKAASAGRWLIGTAVTADQLRKPDVERLITEQFDYLTAEFECFPQFIHPEPDTRRNCPRLSS
jgi:hypothetical protein